MSSTQLNKKELNIDRGLLLSVWNKGTDETSNLAITIKSVAQSKKKKKDKTGPLFLCVHHRQLI